MGSEMCIRDRLWINHEGCHSWSNLDFLVLGNLNLFFISVLGASGNKQLSESPNALSEFDKVSSNYENQLNCGISLSGEDSSFFAKKRVEHMSEIIKRFKSDHKFIMDYGCGTGGSVGYLLDAFNPKKLIAVDVSEKSLSILKTSYNTQQVIAKSPSSLKPDLSLIHI